MDSSAAPLLENVYHEGCPGCKVDRRKANDTGIPYLEFLLVWIVTLCAALPISSLFPFLYFMVKDLHIAKSDEDIGSYAGYVGSSFMLGRTLTSTIWGIIADRYGRKPVILFGIFAVIIFNTLFGLSTSFWMAIITRFLLGLFNGLLGPIKAYSSEICRAEHQSIGLSLVIKFVLTFFTLVFSSYAVHFIMYYVRMMKISTAWGIGLIIGPAVGGYLAQPAEKYPHLFSNSFFLRFPYFLPCFSISLFAVCAFVLAYFWLPETLHMHHNSAKHRYPEDLEASECCKDMGDQTKVAEELQNVSKPGILRNWPLISSIIVYCIFSFHDTAYIEIFSLWAESDKKYGGLGFLTDDVGQILAISGFSLLVFQLSLYPSVERLFGPITSARVAAILSILLLSSYPFFNKLSGVTLKVIVNIASLSKSLLSTIIITWMFILQNNSVEQHQRGAANGLSMTLMSLSKTFAPACAGTLFSFAQKRQETPFLPGDQLVFFCVNIIELLGFVSTFDFFLRLPPK